MDNFTTFWCFRLAALSRKISRNYNTQCAKFGITATQSFVILDLLDNEGSSVKDIAARIQLDSPAVTGVIDRLFKESLVQRIEDPSDRRSLQIFLTPKGRQLAIEFLPIGQEFNRHIKEIIDPEKVAIFENSLSRLEQNL